MLSNSQHLFLLTSLSPPPVSSRREREREEKDCVSERRASESNELLGNKDDLLPTSEVLTLALLTD